MTDHNKAREPLPDDYDAAFNEAYSRAGWDSNNYMHTKTRRRAIAKLVWQQAVSWSQEQARYARDYGLADGYELARLEEQEQARLDSVIAAAATFLDSQESLLEDEHSFCASGCPCKQAAEATASQHTQECEHPSRDLVWQCCVCGASLDANGAPVQASSGQVPHVDSCRDYNCGGCEEVPCSRVAGSMPCPDGGRLNPMPGFAFCDDTKARPE